MTSTAGSSPLVPRQGAQLSQPAAATAAGYGGGDRGRAGQKNETAFTRLFAGLRQAGLDPADLEPDHVRAGMPTAGSMCWW